MIRFAPGITALAAKSILQQLELENLGSLHIPVESYQATQEFSGKSTQRRQFLADQLERTYITGFRGERQPEYMAAMLLHNACGIIEIAEPYYLPEITAVEPNDSLYALQVNLRTMNTLAAWQTYQGDSTVIIGISDTGVFSEHEDLKESIWTNQAEIPDNGIDDDQNGFIDDYRGCNFAWRDDGSRPGSVLSAFNHGTLVAGAAGATTDNKTGIASAGFRSRIFPMKTAADNRGSISYGYISILYCVQMGIKVVNCSWGSFNYSCINESIVEYAAASGTAIICGGGNHNTTAPFYPAGYKGAIGIGLSDENDKIYEKMGIGSHMHLLAPGHNGWSVTTTNGEYTGIGYGTSFAAPVAAGVAAVLMGRFPMLSPEQIYALMRITADSVYDKNPELALLMPRRINYGRAVQSKPLNLPAFRPDSIAYIRTGLRSRIDDTVEIQLYMHSMLAPVKNAEFSLAIAQDTDNALQIINNTAIFRGNAGKDSIVIIKGIRLCIKALSGSTCLLRLQIQQQSDSGHSTQDVFLLPFIPQDSLITLANQSVTMSFADNATIGISDYPISVRGSGYKMADQNCPLLAEAGLVAGISPLRVISSIRGSTSYFSADRNFTVTQPWFMRNDGRAQAVFTDSLAADSVRNDLYAALQIQYPTDRNTVIAVNLQADSSGILFNRRNFAAAIYFDWRPGGSNSAIETAMPFPMGDNQRAILLRSAADSLLYILCGAAGTAQPFATAFSNSISYNGFTQAEKYTLLRSGSLQESIQNNDLGIMVGSAAWQSGDICRICFGAGRDTLALKKEFYECMQQKVSSSNEISLSSMPDNMPVIRPDRIIFRRLQFPVLRSVTIYNLYGMPLMDAEYSADMEELSINIAHLPAGMYFALCQQHGQQPLVISLPLIH
jgi:hypothetical protein